METNNFLLFGMDANEIMALVSLIALIISGIAFYFSIRTTNKVNSKEYQISEELKYSIMQVIAAVRSIDAKAAVGLDIEAEQNFIKTYRPDYSFEIEMITKLQSSPGYLLFLNSIEDSSERLIIESLFRNVSMRILDYDNFDVRRISQILMDHIEKGINKKLIKNKRTYRKMINMCKMDGVFTNIDFKEFEKKRDFIVYLRDQGIIDNEMFNRCTLEQLAETYPSQYEAFRHNEI